MSEDHPAPRPDVSRLVTDTEEPVDVLRGRQRSLLVSSLYASWRQKRKFVATANVGLFFAPHLPPLVPDVMLSLDVEFRAEHHARESKAYFTWDFGKPPDVVIEIVSNKIGGEEEKLEKYAHIGVPYYAIYDPDAHLSTRPLRVYQRHGLAYVDLLDPSSLPGIGLGLVLQEAEYEGMRAVWLRWCDTEKHVLQSGEEQLSTTESLLAEERSRADRLAEKLRALGVDPE